MIVDPFNTLNFIADLQHGIFLMFVTRVGEGKLKTIQYKQSITGLIFKTILVFWDDIVQCVREAHTFHRKTLSLSLG